MARYLLARLGGMLLVMSIVAVLVFVLTRAAPGDPIAVLLGDQATADDIARVQKVPQSVRISRPWRTVERKSYSQAFSIRTRRWRVHSSHIRWRPEVVNPSKACLRPRPHCP